jgi:hypothetical protein
MDPRTPATRAGMHEGGISGRRPFPYALPRLDRLEDGGVKFIISKLVASGPPSLKSLPRKLERLGSGSSASSAASVDLEKERS